MPTNNVQDPPELDNEVTPPDGTDIREDICPNCGAVVSAGMFRTGSVDHPGGPMSICTSCGTRR